MDAIVAEVSIEINVSDPDDFVADIGAAGIVVNVVDRLDQTRAAGCDLAAAIGRIRARTIRQTGEHIVPVCRRGPDSGVRYAGERLLVSRAVGLTHCGEVGTG